MLILTDRMNFLPIFMHENLAFRFFFRAPKSRSLDGANLMALSDPGTYLFYDFFSNFFLESVSLFHINIVKADFYILV